MMSMLTALQAATVIASQSLFAKLSVTMGLRVWQMLAPDKTAQAKLESDQPWIQRVKAAQLNEAEYAPLFVALLVFSHFSSSLSSSSSPEGHLQPHWAGSMAALTQVGYYWLRILTGYPSIPTAGIATLRYGALALLCHELFLAAVY